MQVLAIIPAAFDYFDDIRASAFRLAEIARDKGIVIEPYTLQLGKPTRSNEQAVAESSPSGNGFKLGETLALSSLTRALQEAEIIHLHAPFLGFGSELLAFKKQFPDRPLIITWYGALPYRNLFSLFILGYTSYYLPRLCRLADALVQPLESLKPKQLLGGLDEKIETLTYASGRVQLSNRKKSETELFTYYKHVLVEHARF